MILNWTVELGIFSSTRISNVESQTKSKFDILLQIEISHFFFLSSFVWHLRSLKDESSGVDIFLWRTLRLLDCFQHQLCCLLACKWGISMLNYNSEYANYLPTISERLCANAFSLTEPEMRLCVLVFVWCGKGYHICTKKYSIHSLILWFHALYWYIVSVKVESKQLCSHLFKREREREKTEHRISLI